MIRAAGAFTLAIAVLILVGPPVSASLIVSAEFRDVVHDATLIVRGRITDVRAVQGAGTGVESVGTIAVEATLKGAATDFVSMRVPGGTVGRYRHVMVGAPKLRPGERGVYFLKQGPDGAWRPIGLGQGIYRVQAEPSSGRAVVQPPVVPGITAPAAGRIPRGDARRTFMAVQEFESLVQLVLSSPPPRRAVPRGGGR